MKLFYGVLTRCFLGVVLGSGSVYCQHQHGHALPELQSAQRSAQHEHGAGENDSAPNRAGAFLLNFSSGTGVNPASWSMPMAMSRAGKWNFMWMGQAFVVSTQQSGPRGGDKVYSTNWGMLAMARNLGRGSLMLRGMVSLEPLTVTNRRYPLLFQTGESAYGRPIVDGQHPHDLFMELGIHYARPLSERILFHVYYAPVGDAALGPVAFPHRASALEIPQASLGHHWQDATHIANNVITAGLSFAGVRLEASGLHGREPNENRWNIDMGPIDSWSARITWQPRQNWVAQLSTGRLNKPEVFHDDDVVRTTVSVHYTRPRHFGAGWSTSVIWARNYKTIGRYGSNSLLAETVTPITPNNLITGRLEWSQRDELFDYDHDLAHEVFERTGRRAFNVSAYTAGYTRELGTAANVRTAVGFNVTAYNLASELKPFYGSHPIGAAVFLRLRLDARDH